MLNKYEPFLTRLASKVRKSNNQELMLKTTVFVLNKMWFTQDLHSEHVQTVAIRVRDEQQTQGKEHLKMTPNPRCNDAR